MASLPLRADTARRATALMISLSLGACAFDWQDKKAADEDAGSDDSGVNGSDASQDSHGDACTDCDAAPDGSSEKPSESCEERENALCTPGETLACTTSCGSTGAGMCSQGCTPPTAVECTPPQEVCNWVDDDCDGAIDPGMLVQDPSKTRAVTVTTNATAAPFVLPRSGGGAWLLYKDDSSVRAQLLDAQGRASGANSELVANVVEVRAAAAGPNLVVATSHKDGDTGYISVRVYRSSDLTLKDDYRLTGLTGKCISHGIFNLSAYTLPNGDLRVAVVQFKGTGSYDANDSLVCFSSLKGQAELVVLSRSKAGTWSPPVVARQYGAVSLLTVTPSRVVRAPCRDEWLLFESRDLNIQTQAGFWSVSRYSASGSPLAVDFARIDRLLLVAVAEPETCTGDSAELTVLTGQAQAASNLYPTYLARWQFDTTNGTRTGVTEEPLDGANFVIGAAITRGKSVLIAGMEPALGSVLREYGPDASEGGIPLTPPAPFPSEPGSWGLLLGLGIDPIALADTGSAVAIAAARLVETSAFNAYRDAGDTSPVGAVTYALGCPGAP